ncbi:MAG: dihydrolipoyl dehydrogenase [Halobacteriaceae archaeon]
MVVGDISTGTEVAVIGGGPGGYTAAIRAGQLDLEVTLIERDALGGTCLNYGCIPSKALISATDVAHRARTAAEMGVHADPTVDVGEMAAWKDGIVDRMTGSVGKLCKANGVTVVDGTAAFAGEGRLRVAHGGEGQGSETVEYEHAVLATGSRPVEVPGFPFADEKVLSSRDALALTEAPDTLLVVGGGYIGMELATVFAKLGTNVTVLEMLDDALPGYEDDVTRVVRQRAADLGVDFVFGRRAQGYEDRGSDVVVAVDGETGEETYAADAVLVAVGREPVTDAVDLDAVGVETDDDGFVVTDDRCRTAAADVYAVGDVTGEPMLAHAASTAGKVAAEVIAGEPAAMDHQAVPAAVFTDPEVGTVGMTESEAADAGFDPVVGEFPFRANGRAMTTGHTDGFCRIVADAETGFVLGGQVVGPDASEVVAELGFAVEMGATLEDVAGTIHTHPTLSEAVMEAAENALGHAIHSLNR